MASYWDNLSTEAPSERSSVTFVRACLLILLNQDQAQPGGPITCSDSEPQQSSLEEADIELAVPGLGSLKAPATAKTLSFS